MKNLMRLFLVVMALLGQSYVGLAQEQQVEKPAVSQEDLKRATAEMKRVAREEARKAEERSAEQARLNRELAEKQHEEAIKSAREAEEKLRAEIEQASVLQTQKVEAEQKETRKIMFYGMVYGVASVAVLIIVAISSVFVVARRRHKTVEGTMANHREVVRPEILTDPNLEEIRDYAERKGKIKRVPFVLTLPKEGLRFNCEAELREGNDPLVYIDGSKTPVTWKQRRNKASQLTEAR